MLDTRFRRLAGGIRIGVGFGRIGPDLLGWPACVRTLFGARMGGSILLRQPPSSKALSRSRKHPPSSEALWRADYGGQVDWWIHGLVDRDSLSRAIAPVAVGY